jgi:hypothetical protein
LKSLIRPLPRERYSQPGARRVPALKVVDRRG